MPKAIPLDALTLAANLRSESDSTSAGVKYSTAKNSAKELERLHSREIEMATEIQALKDQLAAQKQEAVEVAAECTALRQVYEYARGVLRYYGVDSARFSRNFSSLGDSIEVVKEIDGGTRDPVVA